MSKVQDYNSSLSDAAQSRKYETFSYLPPLSKESARAQIQYIVDKGWNPGIEHTEPENARSNYWYMWKLPMFGETNVDTILAELEACRTPDGRLPASLEVVCGQAWVGESAAGVGMQDGEAHFPLSRLRRRGMVP